LIVCHHISTSASVLIFLPSIYSVHFIVVHSCVDDISQVISPPFLKTSSIVDVNSSSVVFSTSISGFSTELFATSVEHHDSKKTQNNKVVIKKNFFIIYKYNKIK
jgi:hypothetical protein